MGVALCSTISAAHAAEEAIFVDVRGGTGCPSRESFEAAMRARTTRARVTSLEHASRVFEVRLESGKRGGEAHGALTITEASGRRSTRKVRAASCEEAMQALALATALAIDPNADTKPASVLAHEATARGETEDGETEDATTKRAAENAESIRSPVIDSKAPPRAETPTGGIVIESPESAFRFAPFGLVNGAVGVGPDPLLGFGGGIELAYERSKLPPSIRVSALRASGAETSTSVGAAEFQWTVARLDVCPIRLRRARFDLRPCARGELGTLEGAGKGIIDAKTQTSSWLAFGAVGRARWNVLSPLFLEAEAAAAMPTSHPRFYMRPDVTVHEVPVVVGSAAFSLGLSIR